MPHSNNAPFSSSRNFGLSVGLKSWQKHSPISLFGAASSEEQQYHIAKQHLVSADNLQKAKLSKQDNPVSSGMRLGPNAISVALATAYKHLCTAAHIPLRGEHLLLNPESNRERFEEIHKKGYLPALKELLKLYSNARDYPIETGFKDEQRPLVISALQSIIETKEASASSRAAPSPMKI